MQVQDYALIIQGPIYSPGRTGKTIFRKELTKDSIADFQCEQNILKTVTDFGHVFKSVHIVTWSNEKIDESLFTKFNNCKVVRLENITPTIRIGNKQLPTDFNNKYKQFYALSKGLELVGDSTYTIKIRTDQYVDLPALISEHQSALQNDPSNSGRVFVPYVNRSNFLIADFYFVASTKVLSDFSNAMIWGNFLEFNSSVHIDMSLKYAYLHHRDRINVPLRTYFLNSFSKNSNRDKVILQNYLMNNVYRLLSARRLETTIWRGEAFELNEDAKQNCVFADRSAELLSDETRKPASGIADLLYINYPAYLVVKYPILRNTFAESLIKKSHKALKKFLKK